MRRPGIGRRFLCLRGSRRSKSLQKSLHFSDFVDFLREVYKKVYDPADL
jgi:hypothetical protein